MAEAASAAVQEPLLRGLPDEITIWEILVCLPPPKALLRCRAVCPAWRRATSTHDFLLAHHGRQPTLALLQDYNGDSLDIIQLDHRTGLSAADHLQSVARFGSDLFRLAASCDGLLVLTINCVLTFICNPATRQYAPLPLLRGFTVLGMYMYSPTCEYRLLLYPNPILRQANLLPDTQDGYYVFTIGSGQLPRHIGCPDAERLVYDTTISVLFHGSMHWYTDQMIMVFDITTELFRRMRCLIVSSKARLFEIGGMFGMSSLKDEAATATMDIWVMQDYQSEVWAFKHRVEFPVAPLTLQFGEFHCQWSVVVPSGDGHLLVLLNFGDWLLQMDMDGKLVASFHRKSVSTTQLRLKQTLVPQGFFRTREGSVVNTWPFT